MKRPVKRSAGLLMYRFRDQIQVFLIHPGGPFWARKDQGAWSIPKGEYSAGEDPLDAAQREFLEETGLRASGELHSLGEIRQAGGKLVTAWAFQGDLDPQMLRSNTFIMEWPPRSGKMVDFPEVDRGDWFDLPSAKEKILASQQPFLDRLIEHLSSRD